MEDKAEQYDHQAAIDRRNAALGEAYEMALATHNRIDVWKNGREYVCRATGEYPAMLKKTDWTCVATVEV